MADADATTFLSRRLAGGVRRYWVYMVRCTDGSLYTGSTSAIYRRLKEHNSGIGSKYTRSRLPVALAYLEQLPSKSGALKREARVKQLSRSEKLRLCAGFSTLKDFSPPSPRRAKEVKESGKVTPQRVGERTKS